MTVTWLIEAGVYGDEVTPLVQEIRRRGMVGAVIPHQALRKGSTPAIGGQPLAPDACVIGYGTYPFAQQLLLHHAFVPGAWCSAQNLDCAVYFAHFGRFLLNQPHAILPGVEALRNCDALYSAYGVDERVFARPTSCHKLFVGRCIERRDFATALAPTRYDPAALVVVAAPRPIEREWRLVVIDNQVVAGCQYALHGARSIRAECPAEVRAYAESMLTAVRWRPDPAFMLDVCESAGRLHLVELNSFSGSWLYQCDLSAVVAAAGELARRLWQARS